MALRGLSILLLLGFLFEPAAATELEIVNASSNSIQHLYLARKGQRKWSPDRLDAIIAPGTSRIVAGIDPAAYDVRLSDDADRDCEIYSVVINSTPRIELTDAKLEACTRESH